jgi:hypothetical protein
MSSSPQTNPIVLRRGLSIGTGNAESDDEFLFDCFVDHPAVQDCIRITSPTMIVSGRTGAGKTAILRHVESTTEHNISIDPFEMSMGYVSNSDALRFLRAIGADLDLLFQVLWKHVLCIEFIRLRWNVDTSTKSQGIFARLSERFNRDERRARSLAYLDEWQSKFWITMDQNIKEITESYERKLHAEIGGEIEKFKAGGQYDKRLSLEKKSELVARTRKIISSDQLMELHGIIEILSIADNGDKMKLFYILIDKLDERWVDDTVRFRMIKALIESLKSFRKIQNLKILVALRTDVLERVVQETADISFQREKFEDNTVRLTWSSGDLLLLVNKRIEVLFKRKYTSDCVSFKEIFPPKVGQKNTFDWMLERTLLRPRDIIAFINECFDAADGHAAVNTTMMRKAEVEFSRKRRDALVQEWLSALPNIGIILDFVGKQRRTSFSVSEAFDDASIDDLSLNLCESQNGELDSLHSLCQRYCDGKGVNRLEIIQNIVSALYRTGAVGIKLHSGEHFIYSHIDQPLISKDLVSPETKIRLHPMLHAAYHLNESA